MILQFTYSYLFNIGTQYTFIGVLECKLNLDGLLQVNYELTIMRIKKTWFSPTIKKHLKNIGTILIIK
jgi:hypothetical protein